jgi:hypothetical protein
VPAHSLVLSWLVALLTSLTLTPKSEDGKAAMSQARSDVATEVIEVSYDPSEPPLYKGVDGRAKTAVLLSVIAALETRLASDVRSGHCPTGQCDHGQAVGLMQVHPGEGGIKLTRLGYRRCGPRDASCLHASDLVSNEALAIRLALHMIRQNGLASYCGEVPEGAVTELRRRTARGWFTQHAPPASDESVLTESETAALSTSSTP